MASDRMLTDNEIVKALECRVKGKCPECPYFHSYPCDKCKKLDKDTLDLINRLQAENERLKEEVKEHIKKSVAKRKYDKALIKAEAYKEFAEKLQKKLDPTLIAITMIGSVLVEVSKSHISSDNAIEKIREYLKGLEIETRLSYDMAVCNLF